MPDLGKMLRILVFCACCLVGTQSAGASQICIFDIDCDDGNPDVFPGATEICNAVDDDCDGEIDEDAPSCRVHSLSPELSYLVRKKSRVPVRELPSSPPVVFPPIYTAPEVVSVAVPTAVVNVPATPSNRVHSLSPDLQYLMT